MKNTFELQNAPRVRALLKAQSTTYGSVKVIRFWRFVICILAVGSSFLVKIYEHLVSYSAYYSLVVLGVSVFLSIVSDNKRKHAAIIQQTIDAEVFCMKRIPYTLNSEEVLQLVAKNPVDDNDYIGWYSDYSKLPFAQQVFRCQQENIRWDESVRNSYFWVVTGLFIGLFAVAQAAIIYFDYSVKQALVIAVSCIPLVQYVIQLLVDIKSSISNIKLIRTFTARIDSLLRHDDEYNLFTSLQLLQLSIFEHRRRSVTIPDFVYRISRNSRQALEDKIAKDTI